MKFSLKSSLYLGKIKGVKLSVHWTFLLLMIYVFLSGYFSTHSLEGGFFSLTLILSVFLCVLLHEMGHALTAIRYGCVTRDIILLPIGGMARMEKLPEAPWQEFAVAIAGPLVNLLISVVLYLIFFLSSGLPPAETLEALRFSNLPSFLIYANISLLVFNLVPAFPMDGGRVLRALLALRLGKVRATVIAARVGQSIALVFILIGLFYNPVLALIGGFILLGAQAEKNYYESRALLLETRARDVMMNGVEVVESSAKLSMAADKLLQTSASQFAVIHHQVPFGVINRTQILKGIQVAGPDDTVINWMRKGVKTLQVNEPVVELYREMQQSGDDLVLIYDEGRLVGSVDHTNLVEYILIKESLEKRSSSSASMKK